MEARRLGVKVGPDIQVSALLTLPPQCSVALVLAHGAGAGMEHSSMTALAEGLYRRGVATLRYQFPFMERHIKRTDPPALCHATVRAAVRCAADLLGDTPLVAGGRSFGGRMTSQAQAMSPLEAVKGLVFFGFPLHPAKQPADTRAAHLDEVKIPMLFLQGTRDDLADLSLLRPVVERLKPRATLAVLEHADHSFNVLARSGRTNSEVREHMLEVFAGWAQALSIAPTGEHPTDGRAAADSDKTHQCHIGITGEQMKQKSGE
jgi:predicted alpha/beta-hydrolase family hydrolase